MGDFETKLETLSKLLDRRIELLKLLFNGENTNKTSMRKHIENNKKHFREKII